MTAILSRLQCVNMLISGDPNLTKMHKTMLFGFEIWWLAVYNAHWGHCHNWIFFWGHCHNWIFFCQSFFVPDKIWVDMSFFSTKCIWVYMYYFQFVLLQYICWGIKELMFFYDVEKLLVMCSHFRWGTNKGTVIRRSSFSLEMPEWAHFILVCLTLCGLMMP